MEILLKLFAQMFAVKLQILFDEALVEIARVLEALGQVN